MRAGGGFGPINFTLFLSLPTISWMQALLCNKYTQLAFIVSFRVISLTYVVFTYDISQLYSNKYSN